jgi:hypothetical protein
VSSSKLMGRDSAPSLQTCSRFAVRSAGDFATARGRKQSFRDIGVPKCNLGTRKVKHGARHRRVSVAAAIADDSYTLLVATRDSLRIGERRAIGRTDRKNSITEM